MSRSRAAGLALGYAADRVFGDPSRFHPVAGFGQLATAVERRTYADSRARGVLHSLVLVGSVGLTGSVAERLIRRRPIIHTACTALATWAVIGGNSLGREGLAVHQMLATDDLPAARQQLTHLVGRDTSELDAAEISRATIESIAENTSDAVVAPLVAGAIGGISGLLAYRAANTLDAMVGHRNVRYDNFGWASARLDDLLNLPGARLAAVLTTLLAPTVGGSSRAALTVWRRDAQRHPSPNAGPVEAAFAGALGVTLGGINRYGRRIEDRHTLGDGPAPTAADIEQTVVLAKRVGLGALLVTIALSPTFWPRFRHFWGRNVPPTRRARGGTPSLSGFGTSRMPTRRR